MATTRFDMRLDEEIKTKAEKASALLGMKSLTEYVAQLMENDATQVIAEHESITVAENVFDRFLVACEKVGQPNDALLEAAAFTKDQGIK